MTVFNSLGTNYEPRIRRAVLMGRHGVQADDRLKKYLHKRYDGSVALTYKGREALQLALSRLQLPKNSVVAINGFTCYAVYRAIVEAGLTPHYLDIDPARLHFSAAELERAITKTPSIQVVIIQNTLGYPCDMSGIAKVADKHKLTVIEDIAHSAGTKYEHNIEAGTVGDFVMLSFGRDKMIDAVTGGALIDRNADSSAEALPPAPLGARIRDRLYPLLSSWVRGAYSINLGKPVHVVFKASRLLSRSVDAEFYNGHALPQWAAQLTWQRFQSLDMLLNHRRAIAHIYAKQLDSSILLPSLVHDIDRSTNLRFPIIVKDRTSLITWLARHKIYIADTWYDVPIAPPRYLTKTNYKKGQCPQAEAVCKRIINLPTHHYVTPAKAEHICNLISQWQKSQ